MPDQKEKVYILGNLAHDFPYLFEYLDSKFVLEAYPIDLLSSDIQKSVSPEVFVCSESFDFEGLEKNKFGNACALLILQKNPIRVDTPFENTQYLLIRGDDKNSGVILENNLIQALAQCRTLHDLETSNRQLKTLVYSITHDLRAPLMSLLGLIDIAKDDQTLEKQEIFKLFERSIGRMDEHIKTTLDYYRNQSEEINCTNIDILNLINGIVDMHRNYNQVVEFQVNHNGEKSAHSDPLRLRIALFNLISNAIKYGNKGSGNYLIKIDSDCSEKHLKISVQDFGPGIHPDNHERIFNQFVLESESRNSTGLGLYLTRDAIRRIGGDVLLESEPGKGATFTLDIPLAEQ